MTKRMNRRLRAMTILLFAAGPALSCPKPAPMNTPDPPPFMAAAEPAWDTVFERASGWNGGDVAASFEVPGNRVLWVFGDSFIGEVRDGHRVGNSMVNNAIALHDDLADRPPPPDQITFLWGDTGPDGKPTAWITPDQTASTREWYWPTGGGIVFEPAPGDPALALFLIRLAKAPAADSVWAFEITGGALALIDNVELPADAWSPRALPINLENFRGADIPVRPHWGIAALQVRGSIYIYGAQPLASGQNDLVLARAPERGLENFREWRFYDKPHNWAAAPEDADTIAANVPTEFTVSRIAAAWSRPQYLMVYSEPGLGDQILFRAAPRPEGPWSRPRPIYQVAEVQECSGCFTYAAKAHPALSEPGRLLVSYIVNTNDLAGLADAALYRPRFISIPCAENVVGETSRSRFIWEAFGQENRELELAPTNYHRRILIPGRN